MAQVKTWEKGLQEHFHVTVRRLMMARAQQRKAELVAFKAIVAGLQGIQDMQEAAEEIAGEEGEA